MPLGEKLGRPFELLSLIGRKKKEGDDAISRGSESASRHSLHHTNASTSSISSYHHHQSHAPPPLPPTQPERSGFYPSVQYERLTPSVSQRPPVAEMAVVPPLAHTPLSSHLPPTQHHPHSPNVVQYERLTSSATSSSVQYERLTPGTVNSSSSGPHRQNSPLEYASIPGSRRTAFPSPSFQATPSPHISNLPSPGMLTPLSTTGGDIGRSPVDLLRPAAPGGGIAPRSTSNHSMDRPTPAASDKSTPFSAVMEEWMSQLRTPTPDVTLLPSPFEFNRDTPTPLDKLEDLRRIQDALLPTPPPDVHDQKQHTKSSEYVLNASRRPLVEDIASLCRDLISQELTDKTPPSLRGTPLAKTLPSPDQMMEIERKFDIRLRDDNDDQDDSNARHAGGVSGTAGGGGTKGKRRKMCTVEGCGNLSRSRGLCKAHGGGRRCSVEGCSRASQSGSLCITHGGGKRCTVEGCMKAAQSRGMCKAHGGGVRCRVEDCTKSSQGDGFCRSHGGGRRCGHPSGCTKWAQRNGMCMAHSEGKYGNSYRGRLHRMQDDRNQGQGQTQEAAEL